MRETKDAQIAKAREDARLLRVETLKVKEVLETGRGDWARARKGYIEQREAMRSMLADTQHELVHFQQTVRALHLALVVATDEVRKEQKRARRFSQGGPDEVALAE